MSTKSHCPSALSAGARVRSARQICDAAAQVKYHIARELEAHKTLKVDVELSKWVDGCPCESMGQDAAIRQVYHLSIIQNC